MSIPISQLIPPHLLLLLGVRMFIFYVCLYFCFVSRFISTSILDSTFK